ncbi:hypothetical protein SAMN05216349_11725 [Oribacterium sp. KHPX15]|uniref:hypothetical protein n=1 Tax=Oribacterium sp. KHPX15 TaxID=1855342 RepID=UPI00089B6D71|nr:hypothetical protein [Oribacterium sp. KHPX15]SEA56724.1 hypothetical protein SAMN05216349_11725 [Oribacterium sp. KHPX15]
MNIDDKTFDFAYIMAFRDATMRNAFPRHSDEKDNDFHTRKRRIKNHSKPIVKNYIDAIMKDDNQMVPFTVINRLCDRDNTDQGFTFGNAQKLVNMTAKYMFLSAYGDTEKRELFKNCHCPMDGVMMERLREKCEEYTLKLEKFEIPWSRLKKDDEKSIKEYEKFQYYINQIAKQENIYPIEVDFMFWDE